MTVQTFTLQNQSDTSLTLATTAAPAAPTSGFIIYVDSADNKLKAIGKNGTVTILALP